MQSMFPALRPHYRKVSIQDSLGNLSIILLVIFGFNSTVFGQDSKLSKIAYSGFFGGVTGLAVGGALSGISGEDANKILLPSVLGGLAGGMVFRTLEVFGGEKAVKVANHTSYGSSIGLILGYAFNKLFDKKFEDNLHWFLLAGGGSGLGYGFYRANFDGQTSALFQFNSKGTTKLSLSLPHVRTNRSLDFGASILALSF